MCLKADIHHKEPVVWLKFCQAYQATIRLW